MAILAVGIVACIALVLIGLMIWKAIVPSIKANRLINGLRAGFREAAGTLAARKALDNAILDESASHAVVTALEQYRSALAGDKHPTGAEPAPPPAPPPTVQAPAPAIPELPASVSPVIPVREPALDAVPQPPGAAPDPQRLRCRENLKTLAAAVQTFAADHGQKLPADFRDLQPYLRTPRCLFCPADASNAPFATDKWDQVDWSKTSYQLMAPGAALAGAPSAILHCRAHKTQATIDGQELVPDNELGPRFRGVTPEMMKRYGLKNVDPEMMKRYGLFIPPTAEAAPPAGKAGAPPRDSTAPTPLPAPVPPPLAAPPGIDPTTGLPVSVPPPPATPPGELQSGLFEEDARLNLDAAIRAYQTVVTQFDSQRTSAAQAVFRLAECYRKLGRTDEAKNLYLRITREFPDQAELARLSQQYLNGALPPAAKPRLTHVVTQVVARDQSAATPSREGAASGAGFSTIWRTRTRSVPSASPATMP